MFDLLELNFEATSALDSQSERLVQRALEAISISTQLHGTGHVLDSMPGCKARSNLHCFLEEI